MERAIQPPAQILSRVEVAQNESGLFSSESVLNLQKLSFAGLFSLRVNCASLASHLRWRSTK
jgi:hypothetical protein